MVKRVLEKTIARIQLKRLFNIILYIINLESNKINKYIAPNAPILESFIISLSLSPFVWEERPSIVSVNPSKWRPPVVKIYKEIIINELNSLLIPSLYILFKSGTIITKKLIIRPVNGKKSDPFLYFFYYIQLYQIWKI